MITRSMQTQIIKVHRQSARTLLIHFPATRAQRLCQACVHTDENNFHEEELTWHM